jgi:predicted porin
MPDNRATIHDCNETNVKIPLLFLAKVYYGTPSGADRSHRGAFKPQKSRRAGETMNRKLTAAVTATLLAGFMVTVQADTTLDGNINASVDSFDIDNPNAAAGVEGDDVQLNSNTSAIGVKGSEALGNGLRAIYQAELQIDADDGEEGDNAPNLSGNAIDRGDSSTDAVSQGRDIWGGVEHDAGGQLRAGTISTTYKSYGAMIDPIYRTSVQGRDVGLQSVLHAGKGEEGQGRATNTLRYDSPSWAGFGLKGTFTLDNSGDSDSETKNPYSIGGYWMNGPALIFVDWIDNNLGDKSAAWKVGGKYAFGNFGLYGQYEGDLGLISRRNFKVTDTDVAKSWDTKGADVWFLGASYKAFNTLFFFRYGQGRDASDNPTGDSSKYKAWELAADYAFSKRTDIYGGYSNTKCAEDGGVRCSIRTEKGGELDLFTLGMRVKF